MGAQAPNRPQTASGMTDWEAVFEAPETGLITVIATASSAAMLRKATLVVVETLYARDDDPPEAKRFIDELARMIPDDTAAADLPRIADAVTVILRQIKAHRIALAAAHEAAQENGAGSTVSGDRPEAPVERRRPPADMAPPKSILHRASPAIWVLAAASLALGLAAVILWRPEPDPLTPTQHLFEQFTRAANGDKITGHAFGGALNAGARGGRKFIRADKLPAKACASVAWSLANRGTVMINGIVPARASPTALARLCRRNPRGAEIIWFPSAGGKNK